MNLQFYETIQDKSKKYLTYLIDQILPKFTIGEFKYFLEDLTNNPPKISKGTKGQKTKSTEEFIKIGDDGGKFAELS
ncbi:unnamed protein product, partial [marine sediment metagenome]